MQVNSVFISLFVWGFFVVFFLIFFKTIYLGFFFNRRGSVSFTLINVLVFATVEAGVLVYMW